MPTRLLAILSLASTAFALPRVAVESEQCEDLDSEEISRLLAAELVGAAELLAAPADGETTRLMLECQGDAVVMRVDDRLTSKLVARRVELGRVEAKARVRVLSIAMAELLRVSWLELGPKPSGEAPPTPMLSTPVPREAPSARFSLGVGPTALTFINGTGPIVGGMLLGRAEPLRRVPLEAGAALLAGSQSISQGQTQLLLGSLQLGAGWVLLPGPAELSGLLGVRGGWLRARGVASDPQQALGRELFLPWAGAVLGLDTRLALRPAFLGVRVEAGYTLASVVGRVDESAELELRGAFLAATLLVGLGGASNAAPQDRQRESSRIRTSSGTASSIR